MLLEKYISKYVVLVADTVYWQICMLISNFIESLLFIDVLQLCSVLHLICKNRTGKRFDELIS